MSETKEYIKGDKHVHQAGSIMIKFAQYNVPAQKGDWKEQEEKEEEELEKEFADFEEVVEEKTEDNAPKVKVKPDLPPADVFVNRVKAIVMEAAKKNGETITKPVNGLLNSNEGQIIRKAALDGLGILAQPTYIINDDLESGRLVRVMDDWDLPRLTMNIAYPTRHHLPAKTRLFIDFLVREFKNSDYEAKWTA
jgi:hypothetical protein